MNRKIVIVVAAAAFIASACTSAVITKRFKVVADPPDAEIRVVSGVDLRETEYHSPADIVAEAPKDPTLAAKTFLEVRRDEYRPKTMALATIHDGDLLSVKLEKIMRTASGYRLSYKLIGPVVSPELRYRDKTMVFSFTIAEKSFQMNIKNLSSRKAKILWERAEYTDANGQRYRLMHSGIRFQERNNPVPDQVVPSRSAVMEAVIPVRNVYPTQEGSYDVRPLFELNGDAAAELKGKTLSLFIPIETDRQIIPYQFTILITDAVKETAR